MPGSNLSFDTQLNDTTLLFSAASSGLSSIEVWAYGQCDTVISNVLAVQVKSTPLIGEIIGSDTVCTGLTGIGYLASGFSGASQFLWSVDELTLASFNDSVATVDAGSLSGSISVYGQNECGISDTATKIVTIGANISVGLQSLPGAVICPDDSVQLVVNGVAGFNLSWFKDGLPLSQAGDTLWVNEPGIYEVEAELSGCAGSSNNVTLFSGSRPSVTFSSSQIQCSDTGTVSVVTGGTVIGWYLDSLPLPDLTETIEVTTSGLYLVEVVDASGCIGTAEKRIFVNPDLSELSSSVFTTHPEAITLNLLQDEELREADTSVVASVTQIPDNGSVVLNDTLYTITYTPKNLFSGIDTIIYDISNVCESKSGVSIVVNVNPEISNGEDSVDVEDATTLTYEVDDLLDFAVGSGLTAKIIRVALASWSLSEDNKTLSLSYEDEVPEQDSIFYYVVDEDGLFSDTAYYLLKLISSEEDSVINYEGAPRKIVFYQTMSPGISIGVNDYLVVGNIEDYEWSNIQIFDLFGARVAELKDYNNNGKDATGTFDILLDEGEEPQAWYGTYTEGLNAGDPLPEGTYYIIVELSGVDKIQSDYFVLKR